MSISFLSTVICGYVAVPSSSVPEKEANRKLAYSSPFRSYRIDGEMLKSEHQGLEAKIQGLFKLGQGALLLTAVIFDQFINKIFSFKKITYLLNF